MRRAPGSGPDVAWTWQQIKDLEIECITAIPSFVFLWCALQSVLQILRSGLHRSLQTAGSQAARLIISRM